MQRIGAILKRAKQVRYIGVVHRFARVVSDQVLLRDVRDIIALVILSEQMVKRLIFDRAAVFWDGLIPFICIRKFRIDVKNHTPEGVFFMSDNLSKMIFCARLQHNIAAPTVR